MFLRDRIFAFRERLRAEGKAEGKVERDAEWIEWAKNGKDPDKMPSVANPVKTTYKHQDGRNVFKSPTDKGDLGAP